MNRAGLWTVSVWSLPLSGLGAAVLAATVSVAKTEAPPRRSTDRLVAIAASRPVDSLVRRTIERDPFRSSRQTPDVAYDPLAAATTGAPAAVPKPSLVLTGIVLGTSPEAVLEGLPGLDGPRVLRVGDVVAGLRISSIESGRVTVVGMDTVWVLKVRQPW